MPPSLRIACYQGPARFHDPDTILDHVASIARRSRGESAELLVLSEMALTGYAIGVDRVKELAEARDGPRLSRIREIARENEIALLVGFPERAGQMIYNSVALIDADGIDVACYRKTHLFGEVDRSQYSAGREVPPVFDFAGLKIGLLICYDVEFPETVRSLALRGADLVLVPTALMRPAEIVAETVVVARAFENQVFLAYVNRCDAEASFDYCGLSCVVAPDGRVLARAGADAELILADIDPAALTRIQKTQSHLADRRVDLYDALLTDARTTKDTAP